MSYSVDHRASHSICSTREPLVSGTGFFTVLNVLSITQPVQALKETKTLAIDKFNPEPLFMAGKVIYHLWPYSHR